MIGFLQGEVLQIDTKTITILTTGGVGYQVFPTGGLLARAQTGKPIACTIATIVREQEISLYGFDGEEEKVFFEKLITISGVGPKIAVQILSTPINTLLQAIEAEDMGILTKIPGVGKKMAQKIILELKGKIDLNAATKNSDQNAQMQEAIEALQSLGYKESDIVPVLTKAEKNLDTESLIKFFLSSHV
jgi:Holliday junction DNA helicase RuvA